MGAFDDIVGITIQPQVYMPELTEWVVGAKAGEGDEVHVMFSTMVARRDDVRGGTA